MPGGGALVTPQWGGRKERERERGGEGREKGEGRREEGRAEGGRVLTLPL